MIRVLHIFHNMSNGGIEHFVMNYYRHIDRQKIQFDFLTSVDEPGFFDKEIHALGGKTLHAYPLYKNPVKNYLSIAKIVQEHEYKIVHRHTGSAFGYFDLRAARKGGANRLILHSHNPQAGKPILHLLARRFLSFECERLACAEKAGEFLFGKNKSFAIVPNAIESEKFKFSNEMRDRVRNELNLSNKFVVGHIGRFQEQKNHKKLIEIFAEILILRPDSVLVCVGDGELMQEIKVYAKKVGILNSVMFLGTRDDADRVLQCFDVFCLPSKYEGFSVTLVEAQANGLMCFVSDEAVTRKSNITGNVKYISIGDDPEAWAKIICESNERRDPCALEKICAAGYDISTACEKLSNYYLKLAEEE